MQALGVMLSMCHIVLCGMFIFVVSVPVLQRSILYEHCKGGKRVNARKNNTFNNYLLTDDIMYFRCFAATNYLLTSSYSDQQKFWGGLSTCPPKCLRTCLDHLHMSERCSAARFVNEIRWHPQREDTANGVCEYSLTTPLERWATNGKLAKVTAVA